MSTITDEPGWHEVVRAAVRKVRADGLRIEDGDWGVDWDLQEGWILKYEDERCVCPMGAVLLVHQPSSARYPTSSVRAAAEFLGARVGEIDAFNAGFDDGGGPGIEDGVDQAAYAFGRQMRREIFGREEL